MFSVNVPIALIVVLVTPLSLLFASFVARRLHHMFAEQSALRGEIGAYVEEMVGNQKSLKRSGMNSVRKPISKPSMPGCTPAASGAVHHLHHQPRHLVCQQYRLCLRGSRAGRRAQRHARFADHRPDFLFSYLCQPHQTFNEISGVIAELQTALRPHAFCRIGYAGRTLRCAS